jgi:hypothetical protein
MTDAVHLDAGVSGFAFPPLWPRSIVLKDQSVNVSGLSHGMVEFLGVLADMHADLFDCPLCITSANDGQHAPHSKHSLWQAVDLRSASLDGEGQAVFLMVLCFLSRRYKMAVFDERQLPGAGHFHVEEAG